MTEAPKVLVVGHCTIDDIHHADGRELTGTFGGGAAYATAGATMAGADVTLVTVVGDDYPLDRLASGLRSIGDVDATSVRAVPGRSVHNDAWYGADGSRRFEIESWDRMELLTPGPAELPTGRSGRSIALLTPASVWQQATLFEALERDGSRIALDTELHYLDSTDRRSELLDLAGRADYFLPSIEHLELLFGARPGGPIAYVDELASLGCPVVAVKQGAVGSTVIDTVRERALTAPAINGLRIADTTGAGDGYGGGFLAAVAARCDLAEAASWATVSASYTVESVGASVPDHFSAAHAWQRFSSLRARIADRPLSIANREEASASSGE